MQGNKETLNKLLLVAATHHTRAVGMLNPVRDKHEGNYPGRGGKTPVTSAMVELVQNALEGKNVKTSRELSWKEKNDG